MISKKEDFFLDLKKNVSREIKIAKEVGIFLKETEKKENSTNKKEIEIQMNSLKKEFMEAGKSVIETLEKMSPSNPLNPAPGPIFKTEQKTNGEETKNPKEKFNFFSGFSMKPRNKIKLSEGEKETLKRIKEKEEKEKIIRAKVKRPSVYVRIANKFFTEYSSELIKKWTFKQLQADLVKANMNFLLKSYVSVTLLTTLFSFAFSFFVFVFFMLFNLSATFPMITLANENLAIRFVKTFWVLIAIPVSTFIFMYSYPSLERDSVGKKIEQELPFATINMAAISGSMIDPTKIFQIIISTGEYTYLEKEFNKLLNSVNVLGQDFISALRNSTFNTASKKLAELFSGLATTINSGGNLPKFFQERAATMLFEYNLEREKATKSAETFMDIYISVVVAAPMILMLLLMMMKISGLGIPLSTGMITLIMILGVAGINMFFLIFLQIKQTNT